MDSNAAKTPPSATRQAVPAEFAVFFAVEGLFGYSGTPNNGVIRPSIQRKNRHHTPLSYRFFHFRVSGAISPLAESAGCFIVYTYTLSKIEETAMLPEFTREELAAGLDQVVEQILKTAGNSNTAGRCVCRSHGLRNRPGGRR